MAINRTPFNALVDDDGTNAVGTVWNKSAIATVILDPADLAYASLASPAFTGTVTAPVIAVGTDPATTGGIRLANNTGIYGRNAANTNNTSLVTFDNFDQILMGFGGVASAAGFLLTPNFNGIGASGSGTTPFTWTVINNGHLFTSNDNAFDIGDVTHRVRTIYVGTSLLVGGVNVLAPAVATLTDGASVAVNAALKASYYRLVAAGDRTIAAPTGAVDGQKIIIQHLASGAARTLALTSGAGGFRFGSDITALTQTASSKTDYIGAIYNGTDSRWDVVAYTKGF